MQYFVRKLQTQDKKIKKQLQGTRHLFGCLLYQPTEKVLNLKRVLAYPLTSVHLTFAIFVDITYLDKLTFFSKLEVRIITDAPRNVQVFIVDGMFLVQSHVDLPKTFDDVENVTLSCLVM